MKFKPKLWMLVLPAVVMISLNVIIPFIVIFNYSLHSLTFGGAGRYVGFGEFTRALTDPIFLGAMGRSLMFTAIILVVEIPLGLMVAKFLPRKGKLAGVALILISIPLVIPLVTVGLMFRTMTCFNGIVPTVLSKLGFEYSISNPGQLFGTIVVLDIWHWTPLVVLICAAAYASMPREPIQAAMIDRASKWRIFRNIELPALRFPLLLCILLRFMDSFRIYDEPWVIAGEGPQHCIEFLSTNLATTSLSKFELGYGGACALIYFFIALVITFVLVMVLTKGRGVT